MRKLFILLLFLWLTFPFNLSADEVIVGGEPHKKTEKILYDDDITANSKEYFGWALPGTATSASTWKIMRITYTGDDFVLEWADGNKNYDNEYDNRATTVVYE